MDYYESLVKVKYFSSNIHSNIIFRLTRLMTICTEYINLRLIVLKKKTNDNYNKYIPQIQYHLHLLELLVLYECLTIPLSFVLFHRHRR